MEGTVILFSANRHNVLMFPSTMGLEQLQNWRVSAAVAHTVPPSQILTAVLPNCHSCLQLCTLQPGVQQGVAATCSSIPLMWGEQSSQPVRLNSLHPWLCSLPPPWIGGSGANVSEYSPVCSAFAFLGCPHLHWNWEP